MYKCSQKCLPGAAFIQQSGEPGADDPIIRVRGVPLRRPLELQMIH